MSELDREIGKRLRKARKLRGFKSARSFAKKHTIPESTYSQHETGKRSLSPEIVLRYCDCLGIDPGWLLSGREAGAAFSSGAVAAGVALVSPKRSRNQNDASLSIMDDLVTMDKDILRSFVNEALSQAAGKEVTSEQLEKLLEARLKEDAANSMGARSSEANSVEDVIR